MYGVGKTGGCETHCIDVEIGVMMQSLPIHFSNLYEGQDGIRHIHHRQKGVWLQVAGVVALTYGAIENRHGVIGRSSRWFGLPADDAGQPDPSNVASKLMEVVIAHEFPKDLGDAVKRVGLLYGLIGGAITRGIRPEGCNGAGNDDPFKAIVCGSLQDIVKPLYINAIRHPAPLLGQCGEDRTQVVDRVDLVGFDGPVNLRMV